MPTKNYQKKSPCYNSLPSSLVIKSKRAAMITWNFPSWSHQTVSSRGRCRILHSKPVHSPSRLDYQWRRHTSHTSASSLFAHGGSKISESTEMQQSPIETPTADGTANDSISSGSSMNFNAHHWFTELLPEGWCVGVCTDHAAASMMLDKKNETALNSTSFLHREEINWGQSNFVSDNSRTSYYLGRTALRLSIDTLLKTEKADASSSAKNDDRRKKLSIDDPFYKQLHQQVQETAIMKDYYGRPILPEIIFGSISHKGEYAVGLCRFRPSTWNGQYRVFDNGLKALDTSVVEWREECPILDGSDAGIDSGDGNSSISCSPSVRGIGIDLEEIDAKRGASIGKKILTRKEQEELGGLEAIGISSAEEVLLRFSLKESLYKAMHPILCQYVGFQEAEVTPLSDGTARATLNLTSGAHDRLGIVVQSASWKKVGGFFLTSASVGTENASM